MKLLKFIFGLIFLAIVANAYFGFVEFGFNLIPLVLLAVGVIFGLVYLWMFAYKPIDAMNFPQKIAMVFYVLIAILAGILFLVPQALDFVQLDLGPFALGLVGTIWVIRSFF